MSQPMRHGTSRDFSTFDGNPPALMSIADILARQVPLEWPEAVALVAELCNVLNADERAATRVPDAEDILLSSGGALKIERRAPPHEVSYAARMLHALLAASNTPAPLRLFVSHAIALSPYPSVEAFGEALAYYERPGRTGALQGLFRRCQESPAVAGETSILLAPEPEPVKPAPAKRRPVAKPVMIAAALGTVVVVAAAASWFVYQRFGASIKSSNVVTRANSAIQAAGATIAKELGLVSAAQDAGAEPPQAPATRIRIAPRRPRPAETVTPLPSGDTGLPSATTPGPSPSNLALSAPDGAPSLGTADVEVGDTEIYSSESADVTAPVMISTAPLPPSQFSPAINNTLELVIGPDGEVKTVRLLKGSANITDAMLLSVAKAWRFAPASKAGRPVSYRLVIDWTPPAP